MDTEKSLEGDKLQYYTIIILILYMKKLKHKVVSNLPHLFNIVLEVLSSVQSLSHVQLFATA